MPLRATAPRQAIGGQGSSRAEVRYTAGRLAQIRRSSQLYCCSFVSTGISEASEGHEVRSLYDFLAQNIPFYERGEIAISFNGPRYADFLLRFRKIGLARKRNMAGAVSASQRLWSGLYRHFNRRRSSRLYPSSSPGAFQRCVARCNLPKGSRNQVPKLTSPKSSLGCSGASNFNK